jgi:ABC-type multidrug transport system ATPase subunit
MYGLENSKKFQSTNHGKVEDDDVVKERQQSFESDAELRILNLQCAYGVFNKIRAVQDLSLTARKGQILALLGHNGAGKTTTINCLNGTLPISSGEILLNNKILSSNLSSIQEEMGVCPQHDQLWEELTARQHLETYCAIKLVPREQVEQEITERLTEVNLLNVANKQAGKFSGGMKRKNLLFLLNEIGRLSLAISMVGNPSIAYLDEPTTGLDPASRRTIWDAIRKFKRNKVVILTTHSMYFYI